MQEYHGSWLVQDWISRARNVIGYSCVHEKQKRPAAHAVLQVEQDHWERRCGQSSPTAPAGVSVRSAIFLAPIAVDVRSRMICSIIGCTPAKRQACREAGADLADGRPPREATGAGSTVAAGGSHKVGKKSFARLRPIIGVVAHRLFRAGIEDASAAGQGRRLRHLEALPDECIPSAIRCRSRRKRSIDQRCRGWTFMEDTASRWSMSKPSRPPGDPEVERRPTRRDR